MKVKDIEVGTRIGESSKFRIYLGKKADGQSVILKVAKTFEDGVVLAKESAKLYQMSLLADEIETFEKKGGVPGTSYNWLFAKIETSFMEPTQDDRRINVLTMPDIDLSELTPLAKLHANVTIDARTSVWIMGRFFKLYGFFELIAAGGDSPIVRYPIFSPDDYLVSPEKHRLVYYNFTDDIADVVAYDFVKSIAKFMLEWIELEGDSHEHEYYQLVKDFSEHGRDSFELAHKDLYDLVKKLWGISYYPFTYRERGTVAWKRKGSKNG